MPASLPPDPWRVAEDWRHGQDIDGPLYDVVAADGMDVVLHVRTHEVALLLAAAPKLLRALEQLHADAVNGFVHPVHLSVAFQALTDAKGAK